MVCSLPAELQRDGSNLNTIVKTVLNAAVSTPPVQNAALMFLKTGCNCRLQWHAAAVVFIRQHQHWSIVQLLDRVSRHNTELRRRQWSNSLYTLFVHCYPLHSLHGLCDDLTTLLRNQPELKRNISLVFLLQNWWLMRIKHIALRQLFLGLHGDTEVFVWARNM